LLKVNADDLHTNDLNFSSHNS